MSRFGMHHDVYTSAPLSRRRRLSRGACALTLFGLAVGLAGCGGSSDPIVTPSPSTDQVQQSVDLGENSLTTMASAMDALGYVSQGDPTRSRVPTNGPTITVTGRGTDSITVTVDYGAGIAGPTGILYSGSVSTTYSRTGHTGVVTFTNFTVKGHTINGTITHTNLTVSSTGVSYTSTLDLTISNFGHVQGTMNYSFDTSRTLTITSGNLSITPTGGATYTVTLSNLTINPSVNHNLIPSGGTVTITYPFVIAGQTVTGLITLTYDSQSPIDDTVLVSINGSSPVRYDLPER